MVIQEVLVVMPVKQFGLFMNKSKSWLHAEWRKSGHHLPLKFNIGSSMCIKCADTVGYLKCYTNQVGTE